MLGATVLIGFSACKKEKQQPTINDETEVSVVVDDEAFFSLDIESLNLDLSTALESNLLSARNQEEPALICGGTVTFDGTSAFTVSFNGNTCDNTRKRTGKLVVSVPSNFDWSKSGAVITINFDNYKVVRLSDSKSITLNGTQKYTNKTGGLMATLSDADFLIHSITANGLTVKVNDGSSREWNISKDRTIVKTNGKWVISTEGRHTNNVAVWGTNRLGLEFATAIMDPVLVKQICSMRITEGKIKHTVANIAATITFGLNAEGKPTGCPGEGKYYLLLDYSGYGGNSFSFILPY